MGVRAPFNKDVEAKVTDRFFNQVSRVYVLWLIGIVVGVAKISPEEFSVAGVRYSIKNPEILQGVIFFGCLIYYVAILTNIYMYLAEYGGCPVLC